MSIGTAEIASGSSSYVHLRFGMFFVSTFIAHDVCSTLNGIISSWLLGNVPLYYEMSTLCIVFLLKSKSRILLIFTAMDFLYPDRTICMPT